MKQSTAAPRAFVDASKRPDSALRGLRAEVACLRKLLLRQLLLRHLLPDGLVDALQPVEQRLQLLQVLKGTSPLERPLRM